jgi:3-oxoacyl-[acyl-carrier protein] reductase
MKHNNLDGSVALITGAARGIGQAVALRLASDGAAIAVVDLEEGSTSETVRLIEDAGGQAAGFGVDVRVSADVEQLIDHVVKRFDRLDQLVTCAGVIRDNLAHKMTDDDWNTVIATHLTGTFFCARAAQRVMVPQKSGRMVFVSSIAARGNRGQANYSAAKAGIEGLGRTLALELGRFGINVNVVAPGFVVSQMTESVATRTGVDYEALKQGIADQVALKRVGEPDDIASVVSFFCGDDARYVTGQTLVVGGNP